MRGENARWYRTVRVDLFYTSRESLRRTKPSKATVPPHRQASHCLNTPFFGFRDLDISLRAVNSDRRLSPSGVNLVDHLNLHATILGSPPSIVIPTAFRHPD
jgi:hypothetical protein